MRRPAYAMSTVFLVALATLGTVALPQAASSATVEHRYLVVARSAADLSGLKAVAKGAGASIADVGGTSVMAVQATAAQASTINSSSLSSLVVPDKRVSLIDPESKAVTSLPTRLNHRAFGGGDIFSHAAAQDPAHSLPGLMWNLDRIRSPQANAVTYGSSAVTVAVADTGLDYTHSELQGRIAGQVDLATGTPNEYCKTFYGADDTDLAAYYGLPPNPDWNGHGTTIGGNIGGALDGVGMNGIAPKVNLFDLKIADWCGLTWDSTMLGAFEYATAHHFDVVNMSFGGYLDRTYPEDEAIYQQFVTDVANARAAGTLIVASAGNEHVRLGSGGLALSHGSATEPGDALTDYYGQYEVPAGIPGVVAVSASGNVVKAPSATCAAGTFETSLATCKRASDAHQPGGIGKQDQLAYYSNYGPRIDIAAPGGARKFNLPGQDGGGTGGFLYTTADGYTNYLDFSITSNNAVDIQCWLLPSPTFYSNQCYTSQLGTSIAAPHVSAVAGLLASAKPWLRHHPAAILAQLKATARFVHNYTAGLSATDTSPGDRTGLACPSGYCHLGGPAISSMEAYGAGILDARAALG